MKKNTRKNPVILTSENDARVVTIEFIDGKKYKLQHPGNRTYLEWQQQSFDFEDGLDTISFLDNAFEHCVVPEGHAFQPTIDNVKPAELEVWQKLLRRFLRGDIDITDVKEKTKSDKKVPADKTAG